MAKIKWSKDSLQDLKEIYDFIAADSPRYALIFTERILEMTEHLVSFPEIGRRVPESDDPDVREIIYKAYRIVYQVRDDYVEILTVIHGSRLLKL